ncbi:MAG: hypothetical protein KDI82_08305, partial [Gammaproteobacteria bacterium]|nr:hypothetical protein [Gammaproteobacteria bacterium]
MRKIKAQIVGGFVGIVNRVDAEKSDIAGVLRGLRPLRRTTLFRIEGSNVESPGHKKAPSCGGS